MEPDELQDQDALFLDFDGTLIEIAAHPERVHLPLQLPALLRALSARLGGALALVSGRRLRDLDRMLVPFAFPGAGLHGGELRRTAAGSIEQLVSIDMRQAAASLQAAITPLPQVWLEDKGSSLAVHYRAVPAAEASCIEIGEKIARQFGLRTVRGKMVIEVKAPGVNKGTALTQLMGEREFQHRRPIFIGDDITDEDGFLAAARLGGFGVRIGPGDTAARFRLPDVDATLALLTRAATEHLHE